MIKTKILYPKEEDPNFLEKIYKKREFYYNKIKKRPILKNYDMIEKYRNENCNKDGDFIPREQQIILSNFISPYTPYKGIIIMHGTGVGKTAAAILIAEQFKNQVIKYNTKIYVVVPGPNIKINFKNELLLATGETYLKNKKILNQMTNDEAKTERISAIYSALKYYNIISYKTFYRKILGEKIKEQVVSLDNKLKKTVRRDDEGKIVREIISDKIENMDNTILIIDEAHNMTGNEYGAALQKIVRQSKNLKVILLTATPMKNLASDIIDLLNFIRPANNIIKRDKVFTQEQNYMMKFKKGGKEYLKSKLKGYISYFRGNMPYTFAKRVDMGVLIKNVLKFTPVVRCFMEKFQLENYNKVENKHKDDALDRYTSSAANFVLPGLDKDKKKIIGYYSSDGINKILGQLDANKNTLLKLINKQLFKNKLKKDVIDNFIIADEKKTITGNILKLEYLKHFSNKFYQAIIELNKLVKGKKGLGTAFVYSNLVKAGGIELFANALKMNGYFEYDKDGRYDIRDDSIDCVTGLKYIDFIKKYKSKDKFTPSTFLYITGTYEEGEELPEAKQEIITNVFNNRSNRYGTKIKFILGSKVMNEGITLKNTKEVHILDVHYNLSKVEQVIGRAIRFCKHIEITDRNNMDPEVKVYRYVVSIKNKLSSDENLYKKGEDKYLLIKEIERIIMMNSVDCPLLYHGNKFPEEVEKYKGCYYPTHENINKGRKICPAICNFTDCNFKCNDDELNKKYWDEKNKTYKNIDKKDLDKSTFNTNLAKFEIQSIKNKIKDLYRLKSFYLYDEILEIILDSFDDNKKKLFDSFFLDRALEDLMPRTENEFNNFNDIMFDKFNRAGYLKQYNQYYLFQLFNENENLPFYYRDNIIIEQENLNTIKNYINNKYGKSKEIARVVKKSDNYDFDSVLSYYTKRPDNFIVGIIDMNKNQLSSDNMDVFKVREPRAKVLLKKRGTGIPTFKGATCYNSKTKEYIYGTLLKLIKMAKPYNLDIKYNKKSRKDMCRVIKNILLVLEKYSSGKNKKNYIMIPANHIMYPFPLNLEDRLKNIVKELELKSKDYTIKKTTKKGYSSFEMTINISLKPKELDFLKKLGQLITEKKKTILIVN